MILFYLIRTIIVGLFFFFVKVRIKMEGSRSFASPFECGFDSTKKIDSSSRIHFFIIVVLFLIFDVEIVLLLPIPVLFLKPCLEMVLSVSFFFIILFLGVFLE